MLGYQRGCGRGYDGAEPLAVGKSGPDQAVAEDVAEALTAGRFFPAGRR